MKTVSGSSWTLDQTTLQANPNFGWSSPEAGPALIASHLSCKGGICEKALEQLIKNEIDTNDLKRLDLVVYIKTGMQRKSELRSQL